MVKFKFIHELNDKEYDELLNIVNDEDNMKELGNGKIWTKMKLDEMIKYSKEDYEKDFKNSSYLYLVIIDNTVIGFGYIHPGLTNYRDCCVQIAVLIDKNFRKKGYGTKLQNELIRMNNKYIRKKIYSFVKINNKPSNMLFKQYPLKGQLLFNDIKYNVYDIN